jgi:EAL domain-containing protein (putative c-di-GMP-specific phosphodiesterase class I)
LFGRKGTPVTPGNVLFLIDAAEATRYFAPVEASFRALAQMGFKLGIDLRADQPLPLDRLRQLRPDLLRVGGRRVRGIATDLDEFELILMLARCAERQGFGLLAADCRDRADADALRRAGVSLLQGDYLALPSTRPTRPDDSTAR